jgi:hypothetical protein
MRHPINGSALTFGSAAKPDAKHPLTVFPCTFALFTKNLRLKPMVGCFASRSDCSHGN